MSSFGWMVGLLLLRERDRTHTTDKLSS
jgi:hypothetical protein